MDIKFPTDSDGESSDGDYIPDEEEEDEDEDEAFMDTEDDWDFEPASEWDTHDENMSEADQVEVAIDLWDDDEPLENLGLSDEYESESLSDPDVALSYSGDSYVVDSKSDPSSVISCGLTRSLAQPRESSREKTTKVRSKAQVLARVQPVQSASNLYT